MRKSLVGSGDRSERIRTYNHPQADDRSPHQPDALHQARHDMDGDIGDMVDALRSDYQAEQMASMEKPDGRTKDDR